MFDPIMDTITVLARDAWGFLAGLLIIIALLGALFYVLQGAAGASFGGGRMTSTAIIGAIALIVLVLFAFLVIPQLGQTLTNSKPAAPF